MMRRLLPGLLGLALLVGACGDDDDDDRAAVTSIPEETTTSSSTTTTAPPTVPPDVIPDDVSLITEDYVEQVLDMLYEVSFEALVATQEAGVVDQDAIELSEDIHSSSHAVRALNSLAELARTGFPGFRAEPQAVDTDILAVIEATVDCVFAEATFDTAGLVEEPPTSSDEVRTFVRLRPATAEQRGGNNPTAWVIDDLPASNDGSVPEPECTES